jgi:hypothetical protein
MGNEKGLRLGWAFFYDYSSTYTLSSLSTVYILYVFRVL